MATYPDDKKLGMKDSCAEGTVFTLEAEGQEEVRRGSERKYREPRGQLQTLVMPKSVTQLIAGIEWTRAMILTDGAREEQTTPTPCLPQNSVARDRGRGQWATFPRGSALLAPGRNSAADTDRPVGYSPTTPFPGSPIPSRPRSLC